MVKCVSLCQARVGAPERDVILDMCTRSVQNSARVHLQHTGTGSYGDTVTCRRARILA